MAMMRVFGRPVAVCFVGNSISDLCQRSGDVSGGVSGLLPSKHLTIGVNEATGLV